MVLVQSGLATHMTLICLTPQPEWDAPIFKILANNDTGNAPGHQGGIVIPKDLRPFFPGLVDKTSYYRPTVDRRIDAQLFDGNRYLATVNTRYQYQTWGGERSPESRLTDQLSALRNRAEGGDILLIQRSIGTLDQYRLVLVRKSSPDFSLVMRLAGRRRWGVLYEEHVPLADDDLTDAFKEELEREGKPFKLIDDEAGTTTVTVKKVARAVVFRTIVIPLYDERCAVCGEGLKSPAGATEVEAAHVVPRSQFGADDARNGISLCKAHHWAFDRGLFGVGDDRTVVVPGAVRSLAQNNNLSMLSGRRIREASDPERCVHPDAFAWHRKNLLLRG